MQRDEFRGVFDRYDTDGSDGQKIANFLSLVFVFFHRGYRDSTSISSAETFEHVHHLRILKFCQKVRGDERGGSLRRR